jgi:hypothetical protein
LNATGAAKHAIPVSTCIHTMVRPRPMRRASGTAIAAPSSAPGPPAAMTRPIATGSRPSSFTTYSTNSASIMRRKKLWVAEEGAQERVAHDMA